MRKLVRVFSVVQPTGEAENNDYKGAVCVDQVDDKGDHKSQDGEAERKPLLLEQPYTANREQDKKVCKEFRLNHFHDRSATHKNLLFPSLWKLM